MSIGSAGRALGYLGRPDLTEDRFIAHPGGGTARLYRTGDMARWVRGLDGGYVLECLGRADNQIKLREYRIEPEEIETCLEALSEVRQAAVVLREDMTGDQRLVAYLVPNGTVRPEAMDLVKALSADLPRYMVPSRFKWCEALPLTPNGKTDRLHLARQPLARQPLADMPQSGPRGAWPATQTERDMHKIWLRVLNQANVGVEDDFFELGGHSRLAVKLFTQIKRKFAADLPISTLFANPTIRDLARKGHGPIDTAMDTPFAGALEDTPWDTTTIIHSGPGGTTRPLFIVRGVSGNATGTWPRLGAALRPDRVADTQYSGPLHAFEATAADHLTNIRRHQPQGPYLLAGYSGGVYAAYEMARQLRAAEEGVAFLGPMDTPAPHFASQASGSLFAHIRYTMQLLRRYGPQPLWTNAKA